MMTIHRTAACIAAICLAFAGPARAADKPVQIVIATGGKGGTYYPIGVALADLIAKYLPQVNATVQETSGGVENVKLLSSGKAHIAFANAGVAWEADTGQDKFKTERVSLRSIVALFPNRMHVVTLDGSGIRTMEDLRGKRVSTGSAGSGTEGIAFRMLEAYQLDRERDIRRVALGASESAEALKKKNIDAFIFGGAIPVSAVAKLAAEPGVRLRLLGHADAVQKLNRFYGPLYRVGSVPAKTYAGQEESVGTLDVWDLLVVGEKFDGKLAYDIAKLLFEHKEELVRANKNLEALDMQTQEKTSTLTMHPGAQRYLAEQGVQPFARQFGLKWK